MFVNPVLCILSVFFDVFRVCFGIFCDAVVHVSWAYHEV